MTPPPDAVEVRGLSFVYPDGRVALRDVDLRVRPGERVALLGPNGAGKTTLALHLNGVLGGPPGQHVGSACVRVGGLPLTAEHLNEIRRRVQIVFQDPDDQLFSPTVRDDVAFGPINFGLRGIELASRVEQALVAVGMESHADRPAHHLSFGQRRRVAVATVLALNPEVLVLDEPTANLDPAGRRELREILERLDTSLLVATHDLPFALQLCPRAVILDEGAVVADGPTATLLADTELMAAHRLELPYGFDPTRASQPTRQR